MWGNLQLGLGDLFQIAILWAAIYFVFSLFRGTRSAQMLLGLTLVLLALIALTMFVSFDVLSWLLRTLSLYLFFGLIVIFQPEIRQTLAMLGRRRRVFGGAAQARSTLVDNLVSVALGLARRRHGALIAIEREISLDGYRQSGTTLDAPLVPELLAAIFYPHAPLHDGGVIVRGERVLAARCVFPLGEHAPVEDYGTRHRAALGLSEETDAAVIVVSEERGSVSLAFRGRLLTELTPSRLARYLNALLPEERTADAWRRAWEKLASELDAPTGEPHP